MTPTPQLTVAIPSYQGESVIGEALASILAQDGGPFDLLICDDRSDDATTNLVRQVAGGRARVVINPERLGLAGNWNRCVELSRTPLVAIFHQDDLMRPGHIMAHLARFARADGSTLGFVSSGSDVVDRDGSLVSTDVVSPGGLGAIPRAFAPGSLLPELVETNPFRCSTVTLRAAAHKAVGGFDAQYKYVVDWEFWARLAQSWSVAWLPEVTVSVRWHVASETHRFKKGTADLEETSRFVASLVQLATDENLDVASQAKAAQRRIARAYLNRAYDASRAGAGALGRRCLMKSLRMRPGLAGTILADPRLAFRLLSLWRPDQGSQN